MTTRLQVPQAAVGSSGGGDGPSPSSNVRDVIEIEYPMTVKNEDKYLESLGSETKLQATLNDPQRRLELRFRPDDPWSHGTFADRIPSNSMWVRFKRFKKKDLPAKATAALKASAASKSKPSTISSVGKSNQESDSVPDKEGYHYSAQLMGVVRHSYKFNALADFQFLPMERADGGTSKEGAEYRFIGDSVIPSNPFQNIEENLKDDPYKTFAKCSAPPFIHPSIFSRFDAPKDYFYQDNPGYKPKADLDESTKGIICRDRKSRKVPGFQLKANDEMPLNPDPKLIELISKNKKLKSLYDSVLKMFEERPVWSKNAIMYRLNADRVELRSILPASAYYFINGPFRCLWVKFGYDPRKDPTALKYQALDFRLRHSYVRSYDPEKMLENEQEVAIKDEKVPEVLDNTIVAKRSIYSQSLSITKSRGAASDSPKPNIKKEEQEAQRRDFLYRSFVFKAGQVPSCRQLFYQLCDIELESVQELLRTTQPLETCDVDADGWLPSGTLDKIRDLMMVVVTKMTPEQKRNWPRKRNKKEQLEKLDASLQEGDLNEETNDSNEGEEEDESMGMEMEFEGDFDDSQDGDNSNIAS